MSNDYSPIVVRSFDLLQRYAKMMADECLYKPPFKPLSVVCGNPAALEKFTEEMNGDVPDEFEDFTLFDADERVCKVFGLMNPPQGHKEGAIRFASPKGNISGLGVYIKDPPSLSMDMDPTYERLREITGELGTRHVSAALGSLNEGIDYVAVIGKRKGAFIPMINGRIIEDWLWVPHKHGAKTLVPEYSGQCADSATSV